MEREYFIPCGKIKEIKKSGEEAYYFLTKKEKHILFGVGVSSFFFRNHFSSRRNRVFWNGVRTIYQINKGKNKIYYLVVKRDSYYKEHSSYVLSQKIFKRIF